MDNKPGNVEGVTLQMGSRKDTTPAAPDKSPEDAAGPEGWNQNPPARMEPNDDPITLLQPHLVPEGFDNTVGGELAKRLQEAEVDLGKATGYRVRVTESAGTPLGMLLPSTNPWGPAECGRGNCVP